MLAHEEFLGFCVAKRAALINLTVDVTVQFRNSWIIGNARGYLRANPCSWSYLTSVHYETK